MNEPLAAPHVGSVLADRYELVRHIARGGMGDVYEARDHLLQRPAAVKVFRSAPEGRDRFESEVRILARLNHPGLVQVYDVGAHGDDAFVVLELVDGTPVTCPSEGCPPAEVARLGREVADALAYVHSQGIVHRDVTPSNVLCDRSGRVRLVDFGIVRLLDQPRVTSASITLGTPAYMAPEQVRGGDITPAADVYSLGLVLLELLTGRREFQGTVQEMVIARLARDPDTTTRVPEAWRPLLRRMLHRDATQRPSAAEVAARLGALAADDGLATAPVPAPDLAAPALVPAFDGSAPHPRSRRPAVDRPSRSSRRRPIAMFLTAVAAASLALIIVSGLGDRQPLAPAADAGTSSTTTSPATADEAPRSGRSGDSPAGSSPTTVAADAAADPGAATTPTTAGTTPDLSRFITPRRSTAGSTTSTAPPSTTTTTAATTTAPTTTTAPPTTAVEPAVAPTAGA